MISGPVNRCDTAPTTSCSASPAAANLKVVACQQMLFCETGATLTATTTSSAKCTLQLSLTCQNCQACFMLQEVIAISRGQNIALDCGEIMETAQGSEHALVKKSQLEVKDAPRQQQQLQSATTCCRGSLAWSTADGHSMGDALVGNDLWCQPGTA